MAKVTTLLTVSPYRGLPRFLLSPKNQMMICFALCFTLNAVIFLSKPAVFAMWTYAFLVVGGFQGDHGKANLLMGFLPALCAHRQKRGKDMRKASAIWALSCGP